LQAATKRCAPLFSGVSRAAGPAKPCPVAEERYGARRRAKVSGGERERTRKRAMLESGVR